MSWRGFRSAVLLAVAMTGARSALATAISFEGLADSTPLTTQIPGLTFANATVLTSGESLNELEFPPSSGDNVVFDAGGPMIIIFAVPRARVGGFFTYSVPITLTAFDAADAVLGIDVSDFGNNRGLSGEIGSSPNEFLSVNSPGGIVRVTIEGDPFGGSLTLDDLALTPVPAPPPLFFLAMGLVACAWWGRRRASLIAAGGPGPSRAGLPGSGSGTRRMRERVGTMPSTITLALGFLIALLALGAPRPAEAAAAGITVNGVAVPGAESIIDIKVEVIEFREGGQQGPAILIPGQKQYGVSVVLTGRIAVFDEELPAQAQVVRFAVRADDGRTFTGCIVAGLTTPGSGPIRRHVYSLRCADVSP